MQRFSGLQYRDAAMEFYLLPSHASKWKPWLLVVNKHTKLDKRNWFILFCLQPGVVARSWPLYRDSWNLFYLLKSHQMNKFESKGKTLMPWTGPVRSRWLHHCLVNNVAWLEGKSTDLCAGHRLDIQMSAQLTRLQVYFDVCEFSKVKQLCGVWTEHIDSFWPHLHSIVTSCPFKITP